MLKIKNMIQSAKQASFVKFKIYIQNNLIENLSFKKMFGTLPPCTGHTNFSNKEHCACNIYICGNFCPANIVLDIIFCWLYKYINAVKEIKTKWQIYVDGQSFNHKSSSYILGIAVGFVYENFEYANK